VEKERLMGLVLQIHSEKRYLEGQWDVVKDAYGTESGKAAEIQQNIGQLNQRETQCQDEISNVKRELDKLYKSSLEREDDDLSLTSGLGGEGAGSRRDETESLLVQFLKSVMMGHHRSEEGVDIALLKEVQKNIKIPQIKSLEPQPVLDFLAEVSTFVEVFVVKKAGNEVRNGLLAQGFVGPAQHQWASYTPEFRQEMLTKPTDQFLAHFREKWFPQWLHDLCIAQHIKFLQNTQDLKQYFATFKKQRLFLRVLGTTFPDTLTHYFLVGGMTVDSRTELIYLKEFRHEVESLDKWMDSVEAHFVRKGLCGAARNTVMAVDTFDWAMILEQEKKQEHGQEDRWDCFQVGMKCYGCGGEGHSWKKCTKKGTCSKCGRDHLTSFHDKVLQVQRDFGKGGGKR
jgi:hypothetical protein